MKKSTETLLFWIPRTLSILFLCFLFSFSLDTFNTNTETLQTIQKLFIHNIPTIILATILILSWKNELLIGITYTLIAMLAIILTSLPSIITIPLLLIGTLFLIFGFTVNKHTKQK